MADPVGAVEDMADNLGRKVGPLPAWAWAGMAVAGVTAVILVRRRILAQGGANGAEPEPGSDEPGSALDEMLGSPYLPGGFVVGGGVQGTGSGSTGDDPTVPDAPPEPKTNSDWAQAATRYLIGRNYQPTIVTDAIGRFLSGRPLNTQQAAIIDAAMAGVGAPPQPVPPATVSPTPEPVPSPGGGGSTPKPPAPKPTPKPAPVAVVTKPAERPKPPAPKPDPVKTTVTLKYGDTLYQLYRNVYGRYPSVAQIRAVAAFNGLTVGGPPNYTVTPWRVGQSVKFPTQQP